MPPSTSTTVDKAAPVPTPKTQRPIPDRVAGVLGQWWVDDHRQEQPLGEAGVRFSLEKVAQKVAEGRLHPDVRAWATRKLKEAGNPAGAKARGEVLLNAIRAESGWAPDPTAAEFMPGAHLMLSPDGVTPPKFALGDCDDLTIAYLSGYLAAVESVGARAAVVGHSYSADRAIGHVLGAVFDKGRWWYADPSLPDMPFGECKKPTRERVYAVPSGEMFCDAALCLSGSLPRPPPEDTRGVFLSINGLEDSVSTYPKLLGDFCDVDDPSTGANCGPHPSAQVWDARRSCEQRENIASWHPGEEFEAPDGSDWEPRTQEEFSRAYTGPVGAGARSQNQQEIPVDMVITVPDVSTAETLDLNAISVGPRTARCEPGEGPDGQVRPCASMERPAPGSCNRENFYSDGMPSLSLSGFVDDVYDSVMGRRR